MRLKEDGKEIQNQTEGFIYGRLCRIRRIGETGRDDQRDRQILRGEKKFPGEK
jgi:hypothetical protein